MCLAIRKTRNVSVMFGSSVSMIYSVEINASSNEETPLKRHKAASCKYAQPITQDLVRSRLNRLHD